MQIRLDILQIIAQACRRWMSNKTDVSNKRDVYTNFTVFFYLYHKQKNTSCGDRTHDLPLSQLLHIEGGRSNPLS